MSAPALFALADLRHRHRQELAAKERAAEHRAALEIAAAEHNRVYLFACAELAKREAERRREYERRREEQKRLELERENERIRETQRVEQERIEAQKREENRIREAQRQEEERKRQEARKAEEDRIAKQQQEEALRAQQAPAAQKAETRLPSPPTISQSAGARPLAEVLAEKRRNHKKYLQLHQTLKALRQRRDVRSLLRDQEREITKRVGQISADKMANIAQNGPTPHIAKILREAIQVQQPSVDAREYIINPTTPWQEGAANFQVSAAFIYLINCFAKKAINKFADNNNRTYNEAEVVGIVVSHVFSDPSLQFQGNSFIDILLAKYHKVCPILWGISGGDQDYNRQGGLGAGWAALTLRDYSRVKNAARKNPLPAWHYWQALANILNIPPDHRTETHCVVLNGLIAQFVPTFIKFYGQAACVVLREAVVEYPASVKKSAASETLKVLRETIKEKWRIQL